MLKVIIAVVVSAGVMAFGHEQGIFFWVAAAVACAILETALFNNIVFFIPSAAAGVGAFAQFFLGDAKTAVVAAGLAGATVLMLLYKELTHDKAAEERSKQAQIKKIRGHQY